MNRDDRIRAAIGIAAQDLESVLPPGETIPSDPGSPLLEAAGGPLDSLGLVTFLVAVEGAIESEFGQTVSLVDALAEPSDSSPFRSLSALAQHLHESLDPEGDRI